MTPDEMSMVEKIVSMIYNFIMKLLEKLGWVHEGGALIPPAEDEEAEAEG